MQNDKPMTLTEAKGYASKLTMELRASFTTHALAVAGSVRRNKPNPSDVEIVCTPVISVSGNLFDQRYQTVDQYPTPGRNLYVELETGL